MPGAQRKLQYRSHMNRVSGAMCRCRMRIGKLPWRWGTRVALSMLLLTAGTSPAPVLAQTPAAPPVTTAARTAAEFSSLVGRWVRPDGGYVVTIKRVSADGKLDASYENPNPLPFSRAEATRDGNEIRVFLELTAGGYNGSTYTLVYDPARDVLKGVYYQAIAQQKFDIYFERVK